MPDDLGVVGDDLLEQFHLEHEILARLKKDNPTLDVRYGSPTQKFAERLASKTKGNPAMIDAVLWGLNRPSRTESIPLPNHFAVLGFESLLAYPPRRPALARVVGHPYRTGYQPTEDLVLSLKRPTMLARLFRKIPCVFGFHRWVADDTIVPSKFPCHCIYCGKTTQRKG